MLARFPDPKGKPILTEPEEDWWTHAFRVVVLVIVVGIAWMVFCALTGREL